MFTFNFKHVLAIAISSSAIVAANSSPSEEQKEAIEDLFVLPHSMGLYVPRRLGNGRQRGHQPPRRLKTDKANPAPETTDAPNENPTFFPTTFTYESWTGFPVGNGPSSRSCAAPEIEPSCEFPVTATSCPSSTPCDGIEISVTFYSDSYEGENYWVISDSNDLVVATSTPFSGGWTAHCQTACLQSGSTYTITLTDSAGDGVSCFRRSGTKYWFSECTSCFNEDHDPIDRNNTGADDDYSWNESDCPTPGLVLTYPDGGVISWVFRNGCTTHDDGDYAGYFAEAYCITKNFTIPSLTGNVDELNILDSLLAP